MRDLSSLVISLFGAMKMAFGICYYLNECHAEFFLELIWLLHVIVCAVFLGFKTENPGWLVIT